MYTRIVNTIWIVAHLSYFIDYHMPPKINFHRRQEEEEEEEAKRKKELQKEEIFEHLDRVYLKELIWYSSTGSKDEYNKQKEFWPIQLDKKREWDKQFIFIAVLTEEESICRNSQWQTYQEYMNDYLTEKWSFAENMMTQEHFIATYGKPNVVVYHKIGEVYNNENNKYNKEYGRYIYTTKDNITKDRDKIMELQKRKKEEIGKALQDQNLLNTSF